MNLNGKATNPHAMKRAPHVCPTIKCAELVYSPARYCAKHTRLMRPKDTRPSSALRGYDAEWEKIRAAYLATNPLCVVKGCPPHPATEVHHIVAVKDGGTNDFVNLRSYCHKHHSKRTAHDQPGGFIKRLRANTNAGESANG